VRTSPADRRADPIDGRAVPARGWAILTGRFATLAGLILLQVLRPAGLLMTVRPAAAETTLQTSVDRDSVLIADPINYTIEVLSPPDLLVEPPSPGRQLGPFEVKDIEFLPPEERSGESGQTPTGKQPEKESAEPSEEQPEEPQRTLIRWTLVPYQTGRLEIPPVRIVVIDTSGVADTLQTGARPIEVISLQPDLQGDIRDIKPPEELPRGWAWIGWPIGGLILLAAGLWALRLLRRRRLQKNLEAIPYQGPPRPAHRIALEELDRIAALHLLNRGMVKEHYIQISDAIRRYAEGRYAIGAMELTTWELIGEMKRTAVPEDDCGAFRSFLEECDLVKFAKHIPPAEVRDTLLDRARRLVQTTRIPDRPDGPEEAPAAATDAQPAGVPEA